MEEIITCFVLFVTKAAQKQHFSQPRHAGANNVPLRNYNLARVKINQMLLVMESHHSSAESANDQDNPCVSGRHYAAGWMDGEREMNICLHAHRGFSSPQINLPLLSVGCHLLFVLRHLSFCS